jgi:hypothetical protein
MVRLDTVFQCGLTLSKQVGKYWEGQDNPQFYRIRHLIPAFTKARFWIPTGGINIQFGSFVLNKIISIKFDMKIIYEYSSLIHFWLRPGIG